VSEQGKYLLIDIGNSRAKYATCSEGILSAINIVEPNTDIDAIVRHKRKVIISAVKQSDMLERIVRAANLSRVEVQQVKTEPSTFGLTCAYENFPKLGVDRWLSMLALHQDSKNTFAVIDLGTASTCDFVKGNQHIGGWIAPGYDLMRSSLVSNTFQVTADQDYPQSLSIGNTTESCVNYGCLAYIQGMVSAAEKQLKALSDDYHLYIDGGSHELLTDIIDERISIAKDLVFKGLMRYTESNI
jgi:type III pantothenate kinase